MFVLPVLVAAVLVLWTFVVILRRDYNKKLAHIDGPKGYWLLGNALDFPSISEFIPTLVRYNKQFDGLAKITIGIDKAFLNVSKYDFVEKLLSSPTLVSKSSDYRHMHRWLGTGLLTSTGKKWQQRRKLLTPTFHFQILEPTVGVFNDASDIFIQKLKKEAGKGSFNVYPYITLCTLDVISEAAMGIKMNVQEDDESEYVKCVKMISEIVVNRMLSPLKQFDLLYYFSKDYNRELKALKVLHETTDSVIRKRRELLEKKGSTEASVDEFGKKKRLAFLDLLLTATIDGNQLSDKDIREEVDTFMFEGHDTTSSGISFALFNLAKYPEFQKKVYEEQKSIFSDDFNRAMTYKDLQEMKYLEMFIKESMRLYPPVPMVGRQLIEDSDINGKILPKDLDIGVFTYYIHRIESNFANPEVFDPERFTVDKKSTIKPYAYIPFSAGPRNCIGQRFAMMELKATVSKVVRNYKLHSVPDFEPNLYAELILKSLNGVHIQIENR